MELLPIISSFLILIFSLVNLCLIGAKLIIVFIEQGKLWGRKYISQLVPTFIGLAVTIPYVIDLLIYAIEVAPSILMAQPAFSPDVHLGFGYVFILTMYGSTFNLLILSALKVKLILQRRLKKAHILVKCSFLASWFVNLSMAAAIQRKICKFEFDLETFAYGCVEMVPSTTKNSTATAAINVVPVNFVKMDQKLGTVNGTLISGILIVTLFCVARQIQRRKLPISGIGSQNDAVESFSSGNRVRLAEVIKSWNKTLLLQWSFNVMRLIVSTAELFFDSHPYEKYVGLFVTFVHILCCFCSSLAYLDVFGLVIKYMHHLELRNVYNSSLMHFRVMASRRNLTSSFRQSCTSFHQHSKAQRDAAAAVRLNRSSSPYRQPSLITRSGSPSSPSTVRPGMGSPCTIAMSRASSPGGCDAQSECCSQTTRLTAASKCFVGTLPPEIDEFGEDFVIPVKAGVPILQVEFYRNKDDSWSLCNYESDSCKSLRERAARCFMLCAKPPSLTASLESFDDQAELIRDDIILKAEHLMDKQFNPTEVATCTKNTAFTTNTLVDNPSFFDYPCVI